MSEVREYMERPRVVRAVRWDGRDCDTLSDFCGSDDVVETIAVTMDGSTGHTEFFKQSNGTVCRLRVGDYVVELGGGKFVHMDGEEFEKTYEEVKYGC